MSQESITVLGVGVALAGLILVQGNHNARGLADVRAELVGVRAEIVDIRERLARVETRLAIPATNDTSVATTTPPAD
ncbi:MAG: hypothetical protein F4147_05510 [Gammaproteobacteria bacterium]|nr:hypothetical protein [Gammaproteobacteria bacterium]